MSTFKYLSVYMVEFSSLDNVVCLKTILIICGITVGGQQTTPNTDTAYQNSLQHIPHVLRLKSAGCDNIGHTLASRQMGGKLSLCSLAYGLFVANIMSIKSVLMVDLEN